jgi:hypothetical protein
MRAVLLFIRQRALLFATCRDHPVAFCLRASVTAHARSCPNLTTTKPLMKMAARPDAQPPRYSRSATA